MQEVINKELVDLEHEKNVQVLLAVESGSRAWGFHSPDSDYDVRCVYVHAVEHYLRLEETRDTIEWKLDETLDISGWDLCKFLRLLRGSNPTVFEWLASPIIYCENAQFESIRQVADSCFSPKASAFHYLGIAHSEDRGIAKGNTTSVKKYLYAMRSLLAARWALEEATPVPMLFAELVQAKLESSMRETADVLLATKALGDEHCMIARMPELDSWIAKTYGTLLECARATEAPRKVSWDVLDGVFLGFVR